MTKNTTLYMLGDSHIKYFEMINRYSLLGDIYIKCLKVGGATAGGVMNPKSRTQARVKFDHFIRDIPKKANIGFHLGEVDCGAAIWIKCKLHDLDPYEVMIKSVTSFFEYIDRCISLGYENIFLTSATLPTITDEDVKKERIPVRKNIKIPQITRMLLTQNFNDKIKLASLERGLRFIELDSLVIDPRTGFVSSFLRSKNSSDHHFDYTIAPVLWADTLRFFNRSDAEELLEEELVASQDTFIKSVAISSRNLPASLKIRVKKGQKLSFKRGAQHSNHTRLYQAKLDGLYIRPRYQFIYPLHWQG